MGAASSTRDELQQAVRAALAADNAWWHLDAGAAPPNLALARGPREFKAAVLGAAPGQLVLVDYFRPSCYACRTLLPKIKQLAEQNPDVLVLKARACVNTDDEGMRGLAEAMDVRVLPWFQLWRDGAPLCGFSANVGSFARLRAEVAAHKACTHELCESH
eukprot:scaffold6.g2732.t1